MGLGPLSIAVTMKGRSPVPAGSGEGHPTLPGARKDFQVFKIGLLIATLKGCSPAPSSASCPRSALWAGRYYVLPSFGVGIPVKVNIDSEGSRTAFRGVFKESPGATSSRSPRPEAGQHNNVCARLFAWRCCPRRYESDQSDTHVRLIAAGLCAGTEDDRAVS